MKQNIRYLFGVNFLIQKIKISTKKEYFKSSHDDHDESYSESEVYSSYVGGSICLQLVSRHGNHHPFLAILELAVST